MNMRRPAMSFLVMKVFSLRIKMPEMTTSGADEEMIGITRDASVIEGALRCNTNPKTLRKAINATFHPPIRNSLASCLSVSAGNVAVYRYGHIENDLHIISSMI